MGGILVELRDEAGALLATTRTTANGRYRFTGLAVGTIYQVDVVLPARLQATSPTTLTVQLADSAGAGAFTTDFGAYSARRLPSGAVEDSLALDNLAIDNLNSLP